MIRTRQKAFAHRHRACGLTIGGLAIMAAALGGYSYFETLNPPPDNGLQLAPSDDEIRLARREARDYTCVGNLILHCHDWGPTDLVCGCIKP